MNEADRLETLARGSLDAFEVIAQEAQAILQHDVPSASAVMVSSHGLHALHARNALNAVQIEEREACAGLVREPAIARVVALDENGRPHVFVVSRFSPRGRLPGARLVSYRAPMGRIASLPVGAEEEIRVPGGTLTLLVTERAQLRPVRTGPDWDSHDTRVEAKGGRPVTIASLRALLNGTAPDDARENVQDLLAAILSQASFAQNVTAGFRRDYLRSVALRENPVLDLFQDEVFRLPLRSRVVLMGPPGSGKTTTLIKRLGQKLDLSVLEDDVDERGVIARTLAGRQRHPTSWLMASPTDLLKAYVKKAFNDEGIPASDRQIQTWPELRMRLGRRDLPILRTAERRSGFVLRETADWVRPSTLARTREWFDAFDAWQKGLFWRELRAEAALLAESDDRTIQRIGKEASAHLRATEGQSLDHSALIIARGDVGDAIRTIDREVDRVVRMAANRAINADRTFLDALAARLRTASDEVVDAPEETEDDEEEDDEEGDAPPPSDAAAAFAAYRQTVKRIALAAATRRPLGPVSRTGRLVGWLGDRLPAEADLVAMGRRLRAQTALRHLQNAHRRFLLQVPLRYRRFRAQAEVREAWCQLDGQRRSDLAPLELDLVILAMLRTLRSMVTHRAFAGRLEEPGFAYLSELQGLWKNQILVDEATDFSPVQLAALAALVDPATESVMACGDFNQRTTPWGSRGREDMMWALPGADVRKIAISYRHSKALNEFAHALAELSGGGDTVPELPEHLAHESVPPVLGREIEGPEAAARWLASRLAEIERRSGTLPTVAVLVASEEEVRPVAESLNAVLEEQNLRAIACPDGKFVGQDNEVRVFSVQHIKGLEFEAVFFLGLDRLADRQPDLFDKYLYVGATRAATFLGFTVGGDELPPAMRSLRNRFASDWAR